MESIEEFIRKYLSERVSVLRQEEQELAPFRAKFYTEDCRRDRRARIVAESESETLIDVSGRETEGQAITRVRTAAGETQRVRYHVRLAGDRWLIRALDIECRYCRGVAGSHCQCCEGNGWILGDRPNTSGALSGPSNSLKNRPFFRRSG